jgi:23S rRNA-/tRNA-specific pseudouridylate synthase
VAGHSRHYSLVACAPLTGRKHQIRRHAKMAGHPVVGDRRYGSARSLRYLKAAQGFARLGLHACALDLPMPGTGTRRKVYSRHIPEGFLNLLAGDSGRPSAAWGSDFQKLVDIDFRNRDRI